jgi:type IX secretion system PorP/SprF family membrane protein
MKKNLRQIMVTLLGCLLLAPFARGQDPNYTQYFSEPLYFNPATTGINTGLRARFAFRDQWPNLPVDYRSYYFSADLGDRNLPGSGGFGLIINSDNEGISFIKNLYAGVALSVRIPLSSLMAMQVGIKASIVQKKVNWDDFVFSDQLSEKYGNIYLSQFTPPDQNSKVFPDFGAGGVLQFANDGGNVAGTAGFAVDHLFTPDESFLTTATSPLPRKFVGNLDLVVSAGGRGSAGMYYGTHEPLKLNPGIVYQNQGKKNIFEAGMNLLKYNVYLGAWYKGSFDQNTGSSLALLAGYRYSFAEDMSIKFMYSYDIQMSGNLQGLGGAHEVSLVLEFSRLSIFGGGGGGGSFSSPGRNPRNSSEMESPGFY